MAKQTAPYSTGLSERRAMIEEVNSILHVFDNKLTSHQLADLVCKTGVLGQMSWSTAKGLVTRFFAKRFMGSEYTYSPAEFMKWSGSKQLHDRSMMYFVFTALNEEPLFDFVTQCLYLNHSGMDVFDKHDVNYFLQHEIANRKLNHSDQKIERMAAGIFSSLHEFGFLYPTDKGTKRAMELRRPYLSDNLIFQIIYFFKKNNINDYDIIHHRVWGLFGVNGYDIIKRLAKRPDVYLIQSAGSIIRLSQVAQTEDDFWAALNA
ncbi:MAG: BrxA family protein [Pseudomonadota bacterium]|nr:BrxA family protein [Pseudomonadota bacterium]